MTKYTTIGADTTTTLGTPLTASASDNTKGSYVEITSSAAQHSTGFYVILQNANLVTDFLVDIAVGAAGSEEIILSNLLVSFAATSVTTAKSFYFPISIASGTRIAARCQAFAGSRTLNIAITLVYDNAPPFLHLDNFVTYGAATADSGGVNVDAGAVAHTKGSWSQVTAATTAPIRKLLVALGTGTITRTNGSFFVDIGIGAAASEQVILPNLYVGAEGQSDLLSPPILGPFDVDIPTGTRIAARAQSTITSAAERAFDVVIYGGY